MKTFIAYRFSGEEPRQLEPLLAAIVEAFAARGVEAYCTFFDDAVANDKSLGAPAIMEHAFGQLSDIDFLFVLQTSDNKSEGLLIEVGYCLAKNVPLIVATKASVRQSYLPDLANQSLSWHTAQELVAQIAKLPLA